MAGQIVTLVIHGTFARDETWWRLDSDRASFASRLEAALARRGLKGTVWRSALDAGLDYDAFNWSGQNYHPDRHRGARKLAATLQRLAVASGATAEIPLEVNFVAHSHGGNVVLEALRRLGRGVQVRQIVLLGTPLIAARPALRLLRAVIAVVLFGLLSLGVLAIIGKLIVPTAGKYSLLMLVGSLALVLVFYGWLLLGAAALVDVLLRVLTWPLALAVGRGMGQVYGPAPHRVVRTIASGKITLFTTHDDEADLALQFGAAPRRLYSEFVQKKLHPVLRVAERIVMRPLVYGMVLGMLEAVLERYVLGFPWWHVLFMDSEMADLNRGVAYPPTLVERVDVSEHLLPAIHAAQRGLPVVEATSVSPPSAAIQADRRARTLYQKLDSVVRNLKAQIRLRHSVYYENEKVIERVAEVLTMDHSSLTTAGSPQEKLRLSFWGMVKAAVIHCR
ncbi:MAG: hypothetical protein L0196_04990 [candidate division Zixibacteria bacterium]|nr:hypothetical protein [candidate division Zixibacteria bacterium]